jgi:cyclohexanone monooxygenase
MPGEYNDWLLGEFPKYSCDAESCTSYYRTADGRAPFLFPGDFKRYAELHEESGLHKFEEVA